MPGVDPFATDDGPNQLSLPQSKGWRVLKFVLDRGVQPQVPKSLPSFRGCFGKKRVLILRDFAAHGTKILKILYSLRYAQILLFNITIQVSRLPGQGLQFFMVFDNQRYQL